MMEESGLKTQTDASKWYFGKQYEYSDDNIGGDEGSHLLTHVREKIVIHTAN